MARTTSPQGVKIGPCGKKKKLYKVGIKYIKSRKNFLELLSLN